MNLDGYWRMYDATLARIREEKPSTFAAVKAILDAFQPPSSGQAFFPDGGDDDLASALHDAGWQVRYADGTFVFLARHPQTGARLTYVEGDIFEGVRA